MKTDALGKLYDFYQPAPPSWMPQTAGWYVVFTLMLVTIGWAVGSVLKRRHRNRYRREALHELKHLDCSEIPALLKRTALAAWPRETVASLSGEAWIRFLETHQGDSSLSTETCQLLDDVTYSGATLPASEERLIRGSAAEWIRRHRVRI
jgi:hypothetical protein